MYILLTLQVVRAVLLYEFGDGADQGSRRRRRPLLLLGVVVRPVGAVAASVGLLVCGPGPEDGRLRGAGHGAHLAPLAHSAAAAAMRECVRGQGLGARASPQRSPHDW